MSDEQSYLTFRNQTPVGNLSDCASQDEAAFDLERYGPYLDQMRELFVPSLERRIISFLKEFVYSKDSQLARQFPCFKKFVDIITTLKEPLTRMAEYDIGTVEEIVKNTVKSMIKDDLFIVFLDSIILNNRLSEIYHELESLGIEDDILRNLNIWNLINELDYRRNCHSVMNPHTRVDRNVNSSVETPRFDARKVTKCKEAIKPLATNCDRNTEHTKPTTSRCRTREHRQISNSNQSSLQQADNNSNHFTCDTTALQDNTDEINKSIEKNSDDVEKSKETRSNGRLKMIVRKMYLEICGCSSFSRQVTTSLSLPCNSNNLIRQIFDADPSLSESCLIVMKRKFEVSMYNLCSCLNDILGKLDVKLIKTLYLNCEIRPGYISFKLKTTTANNINKCLFVARVSICQSVRRSMVQQSSTVLSSKSKSCNDMETSKCREQCHFDNFDNNTLTCIIEKNEKLDDTCCSLTKETVTDILSVKKENKSEREIILPCRIKKDNSMNDCSTICPRDRSLEKTDSTMSNVIISCTDNFAEKSKQHNETLVSLEINCNNMKTIDEENSNKSIVKCNGYVKLANNADCICPMYENFVEMSNEIKNIFNSKDQVSLLQTTDYDCLCLTKRESELENEKCCSNTSSIVSFIQNSERDKQLVELNCNGFSDNNITAIDERSSKTTENNSSLNSTKVEIGCGSDCSCCNEDVVDVFIINDNPEENISRAPKISQNNSAVAQRKSRLDIANVSCSNNNSLSISVQASSLKVLSESISSDINHPHSIIYLTARNNNDISNIVGRCDKCQNIINFSDNLHALIITDERSSILPDVDNNTSIGVRSVKLLKGIPLVKSNDRPKFVSNTDSISSNNVTETEKYNYCTGVRSMYMTTDDVSGSFHSSTTRRFTKRRDRQYRYEKSHKRNMLMRNKCECRANCNDIRNITSVTTIKYKTLPHKCQDNYLADIRPLTTFVTTKVRSSINGIKRLIHAKFGRLLFNDKNKDKSVITKNTVSSDDSVKVKASRSYIKHGYSITTYSTSDCRRRSYTISHESSNVILSIRRNRGKAISKKGMKYHDQRLTDDSEILSSFRSIKTSPRLHDESFIFPPLCSENREMHRKSQIPRKKKIESEPNDRNCNKKLYRQDLRNQATNLMVSSQSAKFARNDIKYFEHCTCTQKMETCDNKRVCERNHCQNRRREARHECKRCGKKCNYIPVKYASNSNDKFSEISALSYIWKFRDKNIHEQSRIILKPKDIKSFSVSRKEREFSERDTNTSYCSDDSCERKRVFVTLPKAYENSINDLDYLDFKLKLLRYVELCKSVKQSLLRTLQPVDVCKANIASMSCSDT